VLKKGETNGLMLVLVFNTPGKDGFFPLVLSRPAGGLTEGVQAVKTISTAC
jgi:hypothetical protein